MGGTRGLNIDFVETFHSVPSAGLRRFIQMKYSLKMGNETYSTIPAFAHQ